MGLLELLTLAYGATGFISLIGYMPQFRAYLTNPRATADAPIATWALWSFQSGIVISYAAIINGDIMFILGGLLGATGNFGGLALVLYGRMRARQKTETAIVVPFPTPPPSPKPVRMGGSKLRKGSSPRLAA